MMTAAEDLVDRVRNAWADVLDLDTASNVPLDVNFLDAGGNSLMLVMLWEELHELTPRVLKMSELFQHTTVRAQAALLATEDDRHEFTGVGARDRGALAGRARRAATPAGTE